MLYLDTSVLVSALTFEPKTDPVQRWMEDQERGNFAISDWTRTEFSSAVSMKVRSRRMSADEMTKALAGLVELCRDDLVTFAISHAMFVQASAFAEVSALGLRAGDALQAAVCAAAGATMCTLDIDLDAACLELGIKTARLSQILNT